MKPGATGFQRIINAFGYSVKGLRAAYINEAAFRQELALLIVLSPFALMVTDSGIERFLLISSLLLVIIVELINSAIEAVVDRIGSDHHELSGRAKDIGSAAVLIALLNASIIWLIILYNYFS
ncbi:MAG: diacylglycerol kinase [Gammaproteobacteria bacterium]|nr:diacylglycerol kinase [Gammaproteobacteria bacterium]